MDQLFLTIQPGEAPAALENRLRVHANETFDRFMGQTYYPIQNQFDTNDTPNVYNIGCNLDFNPNDN
ncbi:MAG TPA: hypothetical protein VHG08_15700 [Longimicrobium sp.]|nr:hypothetical protein [Longimicrobium sp.]